MPHDPPAEPGQPAGTAKLPSLNAGRFVAALLVALFHVTFAVGNFGDTLPFDAALRGGHAGVEYFFVLSGFIIYHAHRHDLGRPATLGSYARKRATRILPMLWLVLIGWGVLRILLSGQTTRDATSWSTLAMDMLLLPHTGPLVLGVTWTLQRELVFYLLFAVALLHRRGGLALLLAWQVAIAADAALRLGFASGAWGRTLFSPYGLGFGAGLLIAMHGHRLRVGRPLLLAGLGALGYLALLVLEWRIGGPLDSEFRPLGRYSAIFYTGAAAVCLAGLVLHDRRGSGRQSRLVALLGGASYVLYLVHGPVYSLLLRAAGRVPMVAELRMLLLVAGAVAVAVALHLAVERPILRALRPRRAST